MSAGATEELSYMVSGMSCEHCRGAVTKEVEQVAGVSAVAVDLTAKLVTVRGSGLEDRAIRDAIDEAGYDIA